jgi:hypothetical protein
MDEQENTDLRRNVRMGYRGVEKKNVDGVSTVIAAAVTAQAVSQPFRVSEACKNGIKVVMKVSGVTVVGAISFTIQELRAGTWTSVAKTATSITGNGTFVFKLLDTVAGDQADLPLTDMLRAVITTTNAGDKVTVDSVLFYG